MVKLKEDYDMKTIASERQISDISKAVLEKISENMNARQFESLFGSNFELKSLANGRAIFVADSESYAIMIKAAYLPRIKQALYDVTEKSYEVEISDLTSFRQKKEAIEKADASFFKNCHISSSFTFDNFVIGDSNRMATQAAWAAVNNPAQSNLHLFKIRTRKNPSASKHRKRIPQSTPGQQCPLHLC